MTPALFAMHLGGCLLVSSIGFRRLIYFISIGYAFSIVAQALFSAIYFRERLTLLLLVHLGLLAAYGLRLGTYLVDREKNPAFRREMDDTQNRAANIGRPRQVLIWFAVSLLYVLMFSPALANLTETPAAIAMLPGLALMTLGIGLEALADAQKDRFKRARPDDFCHTGLYRFSRCPNYLGEIVFWIGNFGSAVAAYRGWIPWCAAAGGLTCIVLIMLGSTKRQEAKQDGRYGSRPDYQAWSRAVPVLFPLLPIYSLKNLRVYLE